MASIIIASWHNFAVHRYQRQDQFFSDNGNQSRHFGCWDSDELARYLSHCFRSFSGKTLSTNVCVHPQSCDRTWILSLDSEIPSHQQSMKQNFRPSWENCAKSCGLMFWRAMSSLCCGSTLIINQPSGRQVLGSHFILFEWGVDSSLQSSFCRSAISHLRASRLELPMLLSAASPEANQ